MSSPPVSASPTDYRLPFTDYFLLRPCEGRDSNPHPFWGPGPKPGASANSATLARAGQPPRPTALYPIGNGVVILSDEVDRDKIEAPVSDGLLTVRLPRAAAAESRKIEIKTS